MSSPTSRSLEHLRKQGYLAQVVEKWIPQVKRRQDLYGFIDVLAIRENEVLGVQATSGDNVASRVTKIAEHPNVGAVRKAGIRILVHGWRKNAAGRWQLREVDCS
jgi:carbonic anhydrase